MKKKYFKPETKIVHIDSQITLLAGSVGNINNMRITTEENDEIESDDNIW